MDYLDDQKAGYCIYDLKKVTEIIILFENTVCVICATTKINDVRYESLQPKTAVDTS